MLRLLCYVGLHGRTVTVVDEMEVRGFSHLGIDARAIRSHKECRRCHRHRVG